MKAGHDYRPDDVPLARRVGVRGNLDRRAPHGAVGAAPQPGPADRAVPACETKNIRIGPGGFLLPYHHPAELANRVAMLDHLSEGRLNFGVAASWPAERLGHVQRGRHERPKPRDDPRGAGHHPEDVDGGEVRPQGRAYWHVTKGDEMFGFLRPHLAAAAATASADRCRGPVRQLRHAEDGGRVRLHADEPEPEPSLCGQPLGRGGGRRAQKSGRTPDRGEWRMVREVFVAESG